MPKQEGIIVIGRIVKSYPNAIFDVQLENEHIVKGHISGKIRKFNVNILPNDKVEIELSPYDLTRGRIIKRI